MDKQPQQATDLERLVLGACMLNAVKVEELRLRPEMFYNSAHQKIYEAILDCNSKGSCDVATVMQYLKDKGTLDEIGGVVPFTKLIKYISTNGEAYNHAKIIEQKFIVRQTWEILQKASERCQSYIEDVADIIDDVKKDLTDLVPSYNINIELEKRLRVDFSAELEPAPAVLYIKKDNKLIPLLTLKNISLISGKAKSRKTFLTVLIIAAYLGYLNDLIVTNENKEGIVLVFDTEQSPYDLHVMMKKICTMLEIKNPDRLKAFGLKTLTPEEKVKFIDYVIQNTPGVILVVIDGIRDLVFDINSPEEATKISVILMKWAAENNIHIINVLHQNKGDGNARGHLGTELVNKSEMVLSVNKESDSTISTVEAEYCRRLEFNPFSFIINDKELPELCTMPEKKPEGRRPINPNLLPEEKHFEVLDKIYRQLNSQYPTYTELQNYIIEGFDFAFALSKSREYISHYMTKKWITKKPDGHKVLYKYERAIF